METKQKEKYILAYGFRRFSACRKLGWTTIPAYIQDTAKGKGSIQNIPLNTILVVDNTRLESSDENFTELMQSIKQHGLLQPIGLWPVDELDEQDFIVKNLIENIHRENITPFELSKACRELKKLGLNSGEMAVRLSLPKSKIDNLIGITRDFSENVLKQASFSYAGRSPKKGKIPVSILNAVGNMARGDRQGVKKLLAAVEEKDWSMTEIEVVNKLVGGGMDIEKAIAKKEDFVVITPRIIFKRKGLEKFNIKPNGKYIRAILKGKEPLHKEIFY